MDSDTSLWYICMHVCMNILMQVAQAVQTSLPSDSEVRAELHLQVTSPSCKREVLENPFGQGMDALC